MPPDWRKPFGAQAHSDYKTYEILRKTLGVERCHQLHYLQMATEKLAKTFLTRPFSPPKLTHTTFAKFVRFAKGMPGIQRECRFENSPPGKKTIQSLHGLHG